MTDRLVSTLTTLMKLHGYPSAHTGVVDSAVFQRTVGFPDEYAPGYHVVLDTGPVITVR